MTACVNRKHTKKVAAVVTASLVGALSLGAAPVAAVADTGIDMQALTSQQAFEQGKLTGAKDESGRKISVPSDGVLTITAGHNLVPTEVTPAGGADAVKIDTSATGNASVSYAKGFNAATGSLTSVAGQGAGNYTMFIKITDTDSPYYNAELKINFSIAKAANLADAVLFDATNGDVADTNFTYNKAAQNVGVAIDGKKLVENTDYTITFDGNTAKPTSAGTHTVVISGKPGSDYDGQTKTLTMNIAKLDLSKVSVSVADQDVNVFHGTIASVTAGDATLTTGTAGSGNDVKVDLTYSDGVGSATAVISSIDNTNITGTATVQFNIVDKVVSGFKYGSSTFAACTDYESKPNTLVLNLAEGDSFRESRISISDGVELPESYYTVTYTDADGNAVDASALKTPGVYKVSARIDAASCNYAYGSATETLTVYVQSGTIDSSDVVFKFDGVVGNTFSKTYDGKDFLDQLDVTITTEDGVLSEGTDYTLKAYNSKGEEVDSIVDAASGQYKIVVDIPGYNAEVNATDRTCKVTVNPLNLSTAAIIVNGGDLASYTYDVEDPTTPATTKTITIWYLNYTGEEQDPSFELGYYTDKDGNPITPTDFGDGKYVDDYTWHGFSADDATVTKYEFCEDTNFASGTTKSVDAIKDKGNYKVEFHFDSPNFTGVNAQTTNYITVSDSSIAFADVDPNAWYAQSVFQAKQLGYIKGISGSNIYSPMAPITRADALVIISRMSGFDQTVNGEDYLSQNSGYLTRYSDVDPGTYYAKAVAWATKVGIVHGYDDGTFQPMKSITREEFATMLANYAKAMGKFTASDGTALDSMSDADSVSDWAEESVAWAVANKVMGNKGFVDAQSDITRAEVAAMAVNYQPEKVTEDIIG